MMAEWLELEASRPELPRPVPQVGTPEWNAWRKAWDEWLEKKEAIKRRHDLEGLHIVFERKQPRCLPKSDYHYREPIKRRRKAA